MSETLLPVDFRRFSARDKYGFEGFVPLGEFMAGSCDLIPKETGIYMVLTPPKFQAHFIPSSPVKAYKGKDPSVSVQTLAERWVTGTSVIYIGKAGGGRSKATLHSRLKPYIRFGCGEPAPHWGGRYIWQIKDVRECLLAWRLLPGKDSEIYEKALIERFIAEFGCFPFANLRR